MTLPLPKAGRLCPLYLVIGLVSSCTQESTYHNARHLTPLFEETSFESAETGDAGKFSKRSQSVALSPRALQEASDSGQLHFNLFADKQYIGAIKSERLGIDGSAVYTGHINDDDANQMVITIKDNYMTGFLNVGGHLFEITPGGDERHHIREIDRDALDAIKDQDKCGKTSPPSEKTTQPEFNLLADDGSVVDILVVYTPRVQTRFGSDSRTKTFVESAIAQTNDAYQRSGIKHRLNLVGARMISYDEEGDMDDDLSRLRSRSDGKLDEVHSWRDSLKADLVALIVEDGDYCGVGYIYEPGLSSSMGFSVNLRECTADYTLAHEIGHNMGSHHDRDTARGQSGAFAYSYGYFPSERDWRTIMSYRCGSRCGTVPHFSNPQVRYSGRSTGTSDEDNARTHNLTANAVANFRIGGSSGGGGGSSDPGEGDSGDNGDSGDDSDDDDLTDGRIFIAVSDALVAREAPNSNFGTATELVSDRSPAREAYYKFDVQGVAGRIREAKLRIFVEDGTGSGPALYLTYSNWSESTITWNNRPANRSYSAIAGGYGYVSSKTWLEFDVTQAITGNGEYSFATRATSGDGLYHFSRERGSLTAPQLVITMD